MLQNLQHEVFHRTVKAATDVVIITVNTNYIYTYYSNANAVNIYGKLY